MYKVYLINPFPEQTQDNKDVDKFTSVVYDTPNISGINYYIRFIRENRIDFPYKRFGYSEKNIINIFHMIKSLNQSWYLQSYIITDQDKSKVKFPTDFLNPIMNDGVVQMFEDPIPILDNNFKISDKYNVITDYFIEYSRITARRKQNKYSVYEAWLKDNRYLRSILINSVEKYNKINPITLRESVYDVNSKNKSYVECPHERVTFITALFKLLLKDIQNARVLDPCAGYGDRLISSMILDQISEYIGVEPNSLSQSGFREMIKVFSPYSKGKYSMYEDYMPFAKNITGKFDICIFSPPSFDSELYSEDDGQSIVMFPNRNDWLINFLFKTIYRCLSLLKDERYFVIQSILAPEINSYIRYRFDDMFYLGCVSVATISCRNKPMWIWMKKDNLNNQQIHVLPSKEQCMSMFDLSVISRIKNNEDVYQE